MLKYYTLREKCPYLPAFRLNTKRYRVSLRIKCECGKIRTRKTPNTNTFHAVIDNNNSNNNCEFL